MANLILGPMLRYAGEHEATVWVETDAPCEVEVLGRAARTFHVSGHHYALVVLEGLDAGADLEYEVALDGVRRWPPGDGGDPPGRIRTLAPERGLSVAFGSCRVAAPHEAPWVLERHEDENGRGVDALQALAGRMRGQAPDEWPSLLLMIGDQVYADDCSPETRAFIRSRRSTERPPFEEVADFEEYTRLYRESWTEPTIRWLLSTVPSAMIFDDHEVIDDWNISAAWKREMLHTPWWPDRIAGALMSYWIYQHIGNLSPAELREDDLFRRVTAAGDAGPLLREFALRADRVTDGTRWSYSRALGQSRLVVIDSRAGRLLSGGRREMVDDDEWRWVEEHLHGDIDHLLIVTSLPYLLPHSIHDLEAWNEAVCAGAWGRPGRRLGEKIRRRVDLEHWAAFRSSFERLARALAAVARGERGAPPASIVLMSGDVHYAYLAEASFPGGADGAPASRVYQAVCSPFRHGLDPPMEIANRLAFGRIMHGVGRLLRLSARVPAPPISWEMRHGPYFDNEVATLILDGRDGRILLERTPQRDMRLDCVDDTALT